MRRSPVLCAALLVLLFLSFPPSAIGKGGDGTAAAAVVISGDVTVKRGETVDGVFIVSGDARIAGRVDGDVVVLSGDSLVSGRIDGDLVMASGQARLLSTATVGGDLRYSDEQPQVAPGALVEGTTAKEDWRGSVGVSSLIGAFALWMTVSISTAVLGILLLLIAPRAADAVFERARERLGPVIAIGITILIVLPLTAVLAAITLVGLPLAIALGLALLPLAAIAYVTAAWALGRAIVKPPHERLLAFLAGLAILRAAALLPILGFLAGLGAVIVGFGLIGAAIGAARAPAADGQGS